MSETPTPTPADMFKLMLDIKKTCDHFNNFEKKVSTNFAKHNAEIKTIDDRSSLNSNEIVSLKRRLERCESNHNVQTDLIHSIELQKQLQLRNNISIMGISYDADEKLVDIVLNICIFIGVACNSSHIKTVKRIHLSKSHIIIVQFSTPQIKDAVMKSSARKTIKLSELFEDAEDNRVYINSQVTPFFSKILAYGRSQIKGGHIVACFMTPIGVAIKIKEDSNQIIVKSIDSIDFHVSEAKSKRQKPRDKT